MTAASKYSVIRRTLLVLTLAVLVLAIIAWRDTMADPEVKRTVVTLPGYPADAAPITVALLSDIHVAGPDMPPSRLERIVAQVNALEPDLILIAGDLVSDKRIATRHYSAEEVVAPLGELRAPLGVVVVPGNHDHWFDLPAIAMELESRGILLLANEARQMGPLIIGGLDDDYTGRADVPTTLAAMETLQGGRVILSHSPDVFPAVPRDVALTLAGHTHCGQIAWPWGGSPATMSRYGQRYACGVVREGGRTLVTSGGLGTSLLPFRLFTQPEVWIVTVGPPGS